MAFLAAPKAPRAVTCPICAHQLGPTAHWASIKMRPAISTMMSLQSVMRNSPRVWWIYIIYIYYIILYILYIYIIYISCISLVTRGHLKTWYSIESKFMAVCHCKVATLRRDVCWCLTSLLAKACSTCTGGLWQSLLKMQCFFQAWLQESMANSGTIFFESMYSSESYVSSGIKGCPCGKTSTKVWSGQFSYGQFPNELLQVLPVWVTLWVGS